MLLFELNSHQAENTIFMSNKDLSQEWLYHQSAYDNYERTAMFVKLFAFVCLILVIELQLPSVLGLLLLLSLWFTEAIWKTFQARILDRLLALEAAIEKDQSLTAYQFNSEFLSNRKGVIGLIMEYVKTSLKPTVAFPHAALVIIFVLAVNNPIVG